MWEALEVLEAVVHTDLMLGVLVHLVRDLPVVLEMGILEVPSLHPLEAEAEAVELAQRVLTVPVELAERE